MFSWIAVLFSRLFTKELAVSLFSQAANWFVSSGLKEKAKQAAVQELTDAANQLAEKVRQHAPDMANHVEDRLTSILATAVAGALTRK